MSKPRGVRVRFLSCCAVVLLAARVDAAEVSLVPVRASGDHRISGNEIVLAHGGQQVFLEIFISGWDPDGDGVTRVKAWEVGVDTSGLSSGTAGIPTVPKIACIDEADPDRYCRAQFGGICTLSGVPCIDDAECTLSVADACNGPACVTRGEPPAFCAFGFILVGRPDYVFYLRADLPAVDMSVPRSYVRFAAAVQSGAGVPDPGSPGYAGTLVIDVPAAATGTFVLPLRPEPATVLVTHDDTWVSSVALIAARITIACGSDADCQDGDACTSGICGDNGTCRHAPNYNPISECCDPEVGRTCQKAAGTVGDGDGNGTIDLADIAMFQTCYGVPTLTAGCAAFDMFCECDVTLSGLVALENVLTGP